MRQSTAARWTVSFGPSGRAALACYWKGPLPAINPELIHPKPEEERQTGF